MKEAIPPKTKQRFFGFLVYYQSFTGCILLWSGNCERVHDVDLEEQSSIQCDLALPCHGRLPGGLLIHITNIKYS